MIWIKRHFEGRPWTESAIFNTFETLFMASGGPKAMLLIEQEHAPLVSTLWIRLPNAALQSAFDGFELADQAQLPQKAILLIGHNDEFETLFRYGREGDT